MILLRNAPSETGIRSGLRAKAGLTGASALNAAPPPKAFKTLRLPRGKS